MKTFKYLSLIVGLAGFAVGGAACERRARMSDEQAKYSPPAREPSLPAPVAPSTPAPVIERQPVAGAEIYALTDNGQRVEIHDTIALSQLQQRLAHEDLYKGTIDGHPSAELTAAVRTFQAKYQLSDTGVIDHTTAAKLGLDWERLTNRNLGADMKKAIEDVKYEAKKVGREVKQSAEQVGDDLRREPAP